jgi:hypothetical protein
MSAHGQPRLRRASEPNSSSSIASERPIRASLLRLLFSIRSKLLPIEHVGDDLLFRGPFGPRQMPELPASRA